MPRWLILIFLALSSVASGQKPASDLAIQESLRERLAKSVIGKDGFTVRVKDGVVYWDGSTSVAQHKGAATRMAKSAGARRVVNNIRVAKGAPKPKQATPPVAPKSSASPIPVPPAQPAPLKRARVEWREIPNR
jgi:hypothetical protein